MRSLVAILVLLLWQLNWILPIVAAPLPDALMVESQDISSDNVTQVTELVQRMEPIAANIDNLVYEVAKNRGARFLEMLLASSPQERADLATEYKEPYRIIDDHASDTLVGTNRKAPAGIETWSVEDTTDEIAITVQGHEDVITKTCPTWNVAARKTTKSVTKPAVRQFIYTRKSDPYKAQAIYDPVSRGIMRTTNLESTQEATDNEPLPEVELGTQIPFRNTWTAFESSTIAVQWYELTRADDNRVGIFNHGEDDWAKAGKAAEVARQSLEIVTDSCTNNPEIKSILKILNKNLIGSQNSPLPVLSPGNPQGPFELLAGSPDFLAVLGAPGNRWFFELLYQWRQYFGQRVPLSVELFKCCQDQVGLRWKLGGYDPKDAATLKAEILKTTVGDVQAGGTGPLPGDKHPRPDTDSDASPAPAPKHPATNTAQDKDKNRGTGSGGSGAGSGQGSGQGKSGS